MKVTAITPAGTKVRTPKGITGVTVGTPVLTASGLSVNVAYDAAFAHLAPTGGHCYNADDLDLVDLIAAPVRRTTRAAQGESAVGSGWELLYNKPRQNAQVVRRQGIYALVCVKHLTVNRLARLSDERATRRAGGWCSGC